jgi:putative SOS response-associated peptidase YedK
VTTAANRTLAPLHDRMPVVIAPDAFDFWLDCTRVDALTAAAMIAPAPETLFEAYEISTAVNRTANDSPAVIAPLGSVPEPAPVSRAKPKKDDGQASLF